MASSSEKSLGEGDLGDERLSRQQVHKVVQQCDVCMFTLIHQTDRLSMKASLRLSLSLYLCEWGFNPGSGDKDESNFTLKDLEVQ